MPIDRNDMALLWVALAGESCTVFGKPVRFTVEWPEGLPMGMTEEALEAMARRWLEVDRGHIWIGQAND